MRIDSSKGRPIVSRHIHEQKRKRLRIQICNDAPCFFCLFAVRRLQIVKAMEKARHAMRTRRGRKIDDALRMILSSIRATPRAKCSRAMLTISRVVLNDAPELVSGALKEAGVGWISISRNPICANRLPFLKSVKAPGGHMLSSYLCKINISYHLKGALSISAPRFLKSIGMADSELNKDIGR